MLTLFQIAMADLTADRRRSILSIVAVTPIVAAFLVLMGVAAGLRGPAVALGDQNIVLLPPNALDIAAGRLEPEVVEIAREIGGEDIASLAPMMFRPIRVDETILQLRAANLGEWEDVFGLYLLAGSYPDPGADEIAVTEGVATATGWRVGSTAEIYGTVFTVTGLVRGTGTKFASVWLPYERADRLFEGLAGFQMVAVRPAPSADPRELRSRLDEAGTGTFTAYFETDVQDQQTARAGTADTLAAVATGVGVAALAFAGFNLTALTLAERRRDLAIARSVGFSSRAIVGVVVVRSMALTLVGFAVGGAAASVFLALPGQVTLRSFVVEVGVPASAWLIGLAICLCIPPLGAVAAYRPVSRRPIRDLLEGT